jgi:hypothetical protein
VSQQLFFQESRVQQAQIYCRGTYFCAAATRHWLEESYMCLVKGNMTLKTFPNFGAMEFRAWHYTHLQRDEWISLK